MDLPYTGYNWSLTQHMGMASQSAIEYLLDCAILYGGNTNFKDIIAEKLEQKGYFTINLRKDSGRAETWRDYQQVLSELGLIVSSRHNVDSVHVSPIGLLLLDGQISFKEMITTQALRYQYPNGHKTRLPNASKDYAKRAGIDNRTEIDTVCGVMVKPAILILRALLDLHQLGLAPKITQNECIVALLPIKNHKVRSQSVERILEARRTCEISQDQVHKRNVAEWFTLLCYTTLFEGSRNGIGLTKFALGHIQDITDFCERAEQPDTFWVMSGQYPGYAKDWYEYYGNPETNSICQPEPLDDEIQEAQHVKSEYPVHDNLLTQDYSLSLAEFINPPNMLRKTKSNGEDVTTHGVVAGIVARRSKALLHEEIVGLARKKLIDNGFRVFLSQSVDLLGRRDNKEILIEVKTVTRKNAIKQLRLGVGQLAEYRYRRFIEINKRPNAILLFSSRIKLPSWMIAYLQDEAKLGLAHREKGEEFAVQTSGDVETKIFNS